MNSAWIVDKNPTEHGPVIFFAHHWYDAKLLAEAFYQRPMTNSNGEPDLLSSALPDTYVSVTKHIDGMFVEYIAPKKESTIETASAEEHAESIAAIEAALSESQEDDGMPF